MFEPRWYRAQMTSELKSFIVSYEETDLWIGVNPEAYSPELETDCRDIARKFYLLLFSYLAEDPGYQQSLVPYAPTADCPPVALEMAAAARKAGVGPMAAVAGAFAQAIGRRLEQKYPISDIIVENGGDIYLRTSRSRNIAIWAGPSILSNKLAIEITPAQSPLGICTSSGTVGHSLSFGKADAVTILAANAAVADAYATAVGNMVKTADDIEAALNYSSTQPEIKGVLIIVGDRIGFRGVKLVKAGL